MDEDFFERLNKLLDDIGKSNYSLAKELETSEAKISNYRNNKSKPGVDFLSSLLKKYEVYNMNWLLIGKGSMKIVFNEKNQVVELTSNDEEILKRIDLLADQLKNLKGEVEKKIRKR